MPTPSREEIARLATLTASLRRLTGQLPRSTADDARRCVHFACRCVINDTGLPPLFITFRLPELQNGFELAARWSEGDEVPYTRLQYAWESTRGRADTLSATLSGAAAAHWAVVFAIEAAMYASSPEDDPQRYQYVAVAAEAAARYAVMAHPIQETAQAVAFQTRLLGEIFGKKE